MADAFPYRSLVHHFDRLVKAGRALNDQHRAEEFLVCDPSYSFNAVDDCRPHLAATRAAGPTAIENQLGSFL